MRQLLLDNGVTTEFGQELTPELFKKATENKRVINSPAFKRMKLRFKDEDIIKMNNEVAMNDNAAPLTQAQNGTSKRKDLTEKEYYNPDEPTYKSGNAQIDFLASNPWLMKLPIIGDKIKEEAYKQASKSSFPIRTNEEIAGKSKVAGEKEFLNTKGYQGVWNEDANDPKNVDLLKQYIYGDQNLPLSQYSPKDDYYKFLPSYSLKQRLSTNSTIDKATRLSPVQKKDLEEVIKTRKPKFYHRFDTSDDPALSNIDTQVFYDKAPDLGHYRSGLGYDEDIDTPYAFVTDAWDFYPADYEKDQHLDKENPTNNVEYQQSYLLHKVGKPYKIYDRTYIDPKTKSAVSDKEVGIKKIISNVTPHTPGVSKEERKRRNQYLWNLKGKSYNPNMQHGGEMQYYQDGLDFKPKSISKKGKKIIKDDMGQWAHPGEITEIGSNDITMQGVDYPVLGISDTGDTQMMYPDQDYKFDGEKVTEYPMAQDGKKLSMQDVKRNATNKKYPSAQEMSGGPFQEMDKSLIKGVDVATDLMQLGNFVPHPVGQSIGKAGNVIGGWIDAYQAADAYDKGNYGDAAINLASVALPVALGSSAFKRNSKYLQKGQPLNFLKGKDRVNYIEPFTKVKGMTNKSLMANRALLGTLGAETAYDSKQNGGWLNKYK
jgi:hypothetical protein